MILDRLRAESQQFLMKFPSIQSQSREVVLKSQQRLLGIFNDWELMVEELVVRQDSFQNIMKKTKQALRHERDSCKKLIAKLEERKSYWRKREQQLTEEVSKIKLHLEEGKVIWETQMSAIQKAIVESQDEREQLEERHSQQLQSIDNDVRALMTEIKGEERRGLLAELFSRHDLDEENQIALGNPRNHDLSIDLRSLQSSDSFAPEISAIDTRQIYTRLRELSEKINSLSDESFSVAASSATLNQGFIESMKTSEVQTSRQGSPQTTKHVSDFADFSKAAEKRGRLDDDEISSIECVPSQDVQ